MPYDERLADRVRRLLARRRGVAERQMFGGLAFMVRGHMCCGVLKDNLVLRLGPERWERALARSHVRPMDFTGRPLTGFIYVRPEGYRTERFLKGWVSQAEEFVAALPAKKGQGK